MPKKLPDPPYKIEDRGYTTPCWIWLGCSRKGYGMANNPHYNYNNGKMIQAHVMMYKKLKGLPPDGLVPDHLCRVKLCVNPDHIEWVIEKENIRRGNVPVINLQIAGEIRALYAMGGYNYHMLANRYNISISTISQIITNKTWI